jgi:hypothetical protein
MGIHMKDATADSAKKPSQNNDNALKPGGDSTALDGCYGRIGIAAVAAAARYQGNSKNPAYAPSSTQWRDRLAEEAA